MKHRGYNGRKEGKMNSIFPNLRFKNIQWRDVDTSIIMQVHNENLSDAKLISTKN
jgi:hypothetical protein